MAKICVRGQIMPDLTLEPRPSGWWIIGLADPTCPECGPYTTKAEAEDDRRGLLRAYCANPEIYLPEDP